MAITLQKENVQELMEAIHLTIEEIAASPVSEFYKKFGLLQKFCRDNFLQPDVGMNIWLECGMNHQSIFKKDND